MNAAEALGLINEHLNLQAIVTFRGDEVKCYPPNSDEPGRTKAYLDERTCMRLSLAFLVLSNEVAAATPQASQHEEKKP